jgi:hypothetical protein
VIKNPRWYPDDLEPGTTPEESSELWQVGKVLARSRPPAGAALRSSVYTWARQTVELAPPRVRPQRLWLRVAALAAPGAALFLVLAVGIAGGGPFAG